MTQGRETSGGRSGLDFVKTCTRRQFCPNRTYCMYLGVCECLCGRKMEQGKAWQRATSCSCSDEERGGGRGRGVNAVSVFPRTPKKPRTMQHYSGRP